MCKTGPRLSINSFNDENEDGNHEQQVENSSLLGEQMARQFIQVVEGPDRDWNVEAEYLSESEMLFSSDQIDYSD